MPKPLLTSAVVALMLVACGCATYCPQATSQANAYATLVRAVELHEPFVGHVGLPSDYGCAFNRVARSRKADTLFKALVANGTLEAKLYGLIGIYRTDPNAFPLLADQLVRDSGSHTVTLLQGDVLSAVTLADVVNGSRHVPAIRSGAWTRDFFAALQ